MAPLFSMAFTSNVFFIGVTAQIVFKGFRDNIGINMNRYFVLYFQILHQILPCIFVQFYGILLFIRAYALKIVEKWRLLYFYLLHSFAFFLAFLFLYGHSIIFTLLPIDLVTIWFLCLAFFIDNKIFRYFFIIEPFIGFKPKRNCKFGIILIPMCINFI